MAWNMKRKLGFLTLILFSSFLLVPMSIAWTTNGTEICTAVNEQYNPAICSDGAGGAIIVWSDDRGADYDIYVQRIDSDGNILWSVNGKNLTYGMSTQGYPVILSDGNNGAFIAWQDYRNGNNDVYIQHIDSTGNSLWTLYGVPVCTAPYEQLHIQLCSDMAGGVIVTWDDRRTGSGSHTEIYAQWINLTGSNIWTNNGIGICTELGYQRDPQICSDDAQGAIIAWRDSRSGIVGDSDIYAQRINPSGDMLWDANGTVIANINTDAQTNCRIVPDGSGGAIIIWSDERTPSDYDIYGQLINGNGITQWQANGTAICTAIGSQDYVEACSDDEGGAIMIWQDDRSGTDHDIYSQRVNSTGSSQWATNGIPISNEAGHDQTYAKMVSDGNGGAYITWQDQRLDVDGDVYAQHLYSTGGTQWATNGTIICDITGEQSDIQLVLAKNNGVIIVWDDYRASGVSDIYAYGIIPSSGGGIPGFELGVLFIGLLAIVLLKNRKRIL